MDQHAETIQKALTGSLNIIEQDREKEIISRRFGLNGQKETLEQIGEVLSITRERVRQLEKAIIIRLRVMAEENQIPELGAAEKIIIRFLVEEGRIARISTLAQKIYGHNPNSLPLILLAKFPLASFISMNPNVITTPLASLSTATNAKSSAKLTKLLPLSATTSSQWA